MKKMGITFLIAFPPTWYPFYEKSYQLGAYHIIFGFFCVSIGLNWEADDPKTSKPHVSGA
jgi:hypothetical protein